jgi:antitoxin component YwqK of YwqJK toxin-antitoxin module
MARRLSHTLRHWAWGLTLTFGGATVVAQSIFAAPPQAPANLDEPVVGPPRPVRVPPTPSVLDESAAVPHAVQPEAQPPGTEVIRERYTSRAVKVERHVAQDAEGNFSNHGPWSMWDEQGRLMGGGSFRHGARHGKWVRYFVAGEAEMLSGSVARDFSAPFTSDATFAESELQGKWTVTDSQDRTVFCSNFDHGLRDGKSTWFFSSGQKWREIEFHQGEIDGSLIEWSPQGKVMAKESFVHGRRHGVKTEWYAPGIKKVEAEFLFIKEVAQITDDWWAGVSRTLVVKKEGQDERHGRWTTYYRNGQKALEGEYQHDLPTGTFVWWHPNGQRAIQGDYKDGKQSGAWAWWHANGQRHIQGEYARGKQAGEWTWWTDDGAMAEAIAYDENGVQALPKAQRLETVTAPPELQSPPPAEGRSSRRSATRPIRPAVR